MRPNYAKVIKVEGGCHSPIRLGDVPIFALDRVGPGHQTRFVALAIFPTIDGCEMGFQPKFPFSFHNFHWQNDGGFTTTTCICKKYGPLVDSSLRNFQ